MLKRPEIDANSAIFQAETTMRHYLSAAIKAVKEEGIEDPKKCQDLISTLVLVQAIDFATYTFTSIGFNLTDVVGFSWQK